MNCRAAFVVSWSMALLCAPLAAAQATELPGVPADASCVLKGHVSRRDVTWKLKTRLDAMPSMIVRDAEVTGWVRTHSFRDYRGQPDADVMAVAEIDNSSMTIRALVGPEDLNVVVTKPVIVRRSVIPDTVTDRRILRPGGTDGRGQPDGGPGQPSYIREVIKTLG